MEDRETECLALRVSPQIRLESEGVDGRNEGFDGVERRTGNGSVLRHVTTTTRQHSVHGRDAVSWGLRELQEGGVKR